MDFRLVGEVSARGETEVATGGARSRAVLAALLLNANEAVSTQRIIDLVWGESPPATAEATLQSYVSRLRKAVSEAGDDGAERIERRGHGYRIRLEEGELDIDRFAAAAAVGRAALAQGRPTEAVQRFAEALSLWSGTPLGDLGDIPLVREEQHRLQERHLAVVEDRIDAELACGRHVEVLEEVESLAARHPLRERVRGQLMLALYRAGRQAEALEVFASTRTLLAEELGIDPSEPLRELHRRILQQDPGLQPSAAAPETSPGAAPDDAALIDVVPLQAGRVARRTPFVGRDRERAEVEVALDRLVTDGTGGLFLFAGEPGIGKTKLAETVAVAATERGVRVTWGRAWEGDGVPVFFSWKPVLRALVEDLGPDVVAAATGRGTAHLAMLVPGLEAHAGEPVNLFDDNARFALFEAVSTVVNLAARAVPRLIILDDLHSADRSSLELFRFIANDVRGTPLLLLGLYRDGDAARRADLGDLLAALTRSGTVIPLRGLSEDGVLTLMERLSGVMPPPGLCAAVHQATEGNPFFVDEVTRLLHAEDRLDDELGPGDDLPVPNTVREVVLRRCQDLDEATADLLRTAAVTGREVDVATLSQVADRPIDETLASLDALCAVGILEEHDLEAGRYRFRHDLARDVLALDLSQAARLALHVRIADVFARRVGDTGGSHLGDIAHHYERAGPLGYFGHACDYATRAGHRAMEHLAYEDAAVHYETALRAAERTGEEDDARRCDLLIAIAAARRRAGAFEIARDRLLEAADLARKLDDPVRLTMVTMSYAPGWVGYDLDGLADRSLISLLEDVHDRLPEGDSAQRVRLMGRLAVALYWTDDVERRATLGAEAVAMAERLGDDAALAFALGSRRHATCGPDGFEERLAGSRRSLELSLATGELDLAVQAHRWHLSDLLEIGDVAGVDAQLLAHDRLVRDLRQPAHYPYTSLFSAMRAIMAGRYDEGEGFAHEGFAHAERVQSRTALTFFGAVLFPCWWQRGQLAALEPAIDAIVEQAPPRPIVKTSLAVLSIEVGRQEQAAALLGDALAQGLDGVARDVLWLPTLSMSAHVAARLGDVELARALLERLAPYSGRVVTVGVPAVGAWGPVDLYVGEVAMAAGEPGLAAEHLGRALTLSQAMGTRPMSAIVEAELADVLEVTDAARARELRTSAAGVAKELSMDALLARLEG